MPLSEHEQRVLDQIERSLLADDPTFATQIGSSRRNGPSRLRLVTGLGLGLVGLAVVLLGVATQQVWLGALGFLLMVAAGAWALHGGRRALVPHAPDAPTNVTSLAVARKRKPRGGAKGAQRGGSFMDRLEERWDRRMEHREDW